MGLDKIKASILLLAFVTVVAALTAEAYMKCTLKSVCSTIETILPVITFVLFILAGVAYAVGQFFGAETRAKAVGWSMSIITGAIVALIIYVLGPVIITAMGGGSTTGCAGITITGTCPS